MPYSGRFIPKNPKKYVGDSTNIIYRSRWEFLFCSFCDRRDDIISWASEELAIPYRSPIDGRVHRYFPDFLIKKKDKLGNQSIVLIEIKPAAQTKPPKKPLRNSKNYLYEVRQYGINEAKWKAAQEYCEDKGWKFQILTEKELGIKF